ncbi:hypothetical protein [Mucilaginibacter aquariorum]|uniref:Uncharacterized protein n=1 Tax=Mucilaginibacter aquariorum TaxID=2967225 RepID=A0ABT1T5F6_9SPHI|nr:hypothetical protein [Mucilaginibacter aquariorum]MCQ6959615.1 hypothetical protein [Mucilaginibacter aquariorum]
MNLKGNILKSCLILIAISVLTYILLKQKETGDKEALLSNINGVVTEVKYDVKRNATFIVNEKQFYSFSFFWDKYKYSIEVGDTLVKKSRSLKLEIKKKRSLTR